MGFGDFFRSLLVIIFTLGIIALCTCGVYIIAESFGRVDPKQVSSDCVVVDKKFSGGSWYVVYKKGDSFNYLLGVDPYYKYEIGDTIKSVVEK